MSETRYPHWIYYPNWSEPPLWATTLTAVFEEVQASIDSRVTHRKSNEALGLLRPGLEAAKFVVEGGKALKRFAVRFTSANSAMQAERTGSTPTKKNGSLHWRWRLAERLKGMRFIET